MNVGENFYNPNLPVYLSVDWGFRMPAALFWTVKNIDGIDHAYIIDEIIHETNLKTSELVDKIRAKKYRIVQVFGDPAGYQVQSSIGVGEAHLFYQLFGKQIFALRDKASRSINSGISHVRSFICAKDGTRRLHIVKKCTGIIEDLESYRYPEAKENFALKPLPLKDGYSDHGNDSLRYFLVNKFPIRNYKLRTSK